MHTASAKIWKARLAAGLLLLAPLPVLASPSAEIAAAVQAKLDEALAEQKVFLSCLATTEKDGDVTETSWRQEFEGAIAIMRDAGFDAAMIDGFAAQAEPAALMLNEVPLGEVIAFCRSQEDWLNKRYRLQYVILPLALPKIIGGG